MATIQAIPVELRVILIGCGETMQDFKQEYLCTPAEPLYRSSIIDLKTIYDTIERLDFRNTKEKKEFAEKLCQKFTPFVLYSDLVLYSKEQAAKSK